ncbi:RsmE family RNA methyltransferase [Coleofasciculus sp. FACHB-1120]|uniref:RsmE family RNA methyltransferase n=1 Tax=Coleofasciculus sp. FACHB-1120 TaxID=2692783 RepID=UPI0016853602|nr:RsmE family RNA methyltransferase [Coleofasciculus sp. FACHB-1120]MBD2741692.1 16S rRNA (uracil(1498)-N(3))-methyltransferase [Coleofasciculus sp. FACHB-1120]
MAQLQRLAIAPSQFQNQQIILTAEQQHYLSRVLRLREGDRFIAMDGQGHWWLAKLEANQGQLLEPISVQTELPCSMTLMLALPKNGFDEVVRYSTELGVVAIAPVVSDRSLLNPSPQKLERWRRIAQEAAEQSERQIVPTILEPVSFSTALSSLNSHSSLTKNKNYICVARGDSPHLLDCLIDLLPQETSPPTPPLVGEGSPAPPSLVGKGAGGLGFLGIADELKNPGQGTIVIAIGPEGGWTPAEVEQAIAADFQPVSLGRRVLRAVTAPMVALSLVAAAWESEIREI